MTPPLHAVDLQPDVPPLMHQKDCLTLIRDGNLHSEWRPFLYALEGGLLPLGLDRVAGDGTRRPVLLGMIMMKAPLAVVGAAIRAGCPTDPDHYLPAVASGNPLKLDVLRRYRTPATGLSIPASTLLSSALPHKQPGLVERVWRLRDDWDAADLRENARLFDMALSQQSPLAVMEFLLERRIGPSLRLLNDGVTTLPTGLTRRLLAHGWPLPPCREGGVGSCCGGCLPCH